MHRKAVLDLISVFGAMVLFGAWVFQQTLLNEANSALQTIRAAESVFQTYQSNNALFSAIASTAPTVVSEVRRFQIINYEYGLGHLEELLDPEQRTHIPIPSRPLDSDWDADTAGQRLNERIRAIQSGVKQRKDEILARSSRTNWTFLAMYGAGSLLILTANVYKLFQSSND
jgi:hypothetical protein